MDQGTTIQRYASRNLQKKRMAHCGTRVRSAGDWRLHMTRHARQGESFPGRRRPPDQRHPNKAQ